MVSDPTQAVWRRLSPPTWALSPLLPPPLGVIEPPAPVKTARNPHGCTRAHHDAFRRKRKTLQFAQWFKNTHTTPHALARDVPGLSARAMTDRLSGNKVMSDGVEAKWETACGGRLPDHPNPCLYYWWNEHYEWPRMPQTIPAQQALWSYPLWLFIIATELMYGYAEPCYCVVVPQARNLYTLARTRGPILDWIEIGPLAQAVVGFDRRRDESRPGLVARIAADPAAAVEEQIQQRVAHFEGGRLPRGWALDSERYMPPRQREREFETGPPPVRGPS